MTTNDPLNFLDEKPEGKIEEPAKATVQTEPVKEPSKEPDKAAAPAEEGSRPEVKPPAQEPPKESHQVPLAKYLDTYNDNRELKQQVQRLQRALKDKEAPPQLPDPIADPDGYRKAILSESQQQWQGQLDTRVHQISEEMAVTAHGAEKVDAALKALEEANDPYAHQRIMNSRHPYGELVKWHEREQMLGNIGSDPDAWALRRAEELQRLKQPGVLDTQTLKPKAEQQMPAPSLARAPASPHASTAPVGAGQSFDAVFPT